MMERHQTRTEIGTRPDSLFAGVELGGTKCICILASGRDDIRETIRIPTTTPAETLAAIHDVVALWHRQHGLAALGIASFGPLDLDPASPAYGAFVATPKPGWSGARLGGIGQGLGIPVAIDTDVNGAALAEGRWGAAQGLDSWAYVTLGTGIGIGSIVGHLPVRGLGHSEAGHMRVGGPADGWKGICPYHGDCAEGLVSGPAIAARAGRPAATIAPDDPMWDEVAATLARLFHNLVFTTVPQRILLGGGVALGQPQLFPAIRRRLVESLGGYAFADRIRREIDCFLVPPALGDQAGPLGAIALARGAPPVTDGPT
jgi:fructokinase